MFELFQPASETDKASFDKCVAMIKIRPDVIVDVGNIQANVIVVTLLDSAINSLYHTLHKLYAPLLTDKFVAAADSGLMSLVKELDTKLAATSRAVDSRAAVNLEDDRNYFGEYIQSLVLIQY